jgi:phospho-N-acetylmuramoyl-pentapeptide-transferase
MTEWLTAHLIPAVNSLASVSSGLANDILPAAVILRVCAAVAASLSTALICGPSLIRWLQLRFRERIVSDSSTLNQLHASKANTPTMGGLLIVGAVIISLVAQMFAAPDVGSLALIVLSACSAAVFLTIGAVDDWQKATGRSKGLTVRQKFVLQWLAGLGTAYGLWAIRRSLPGGTDSSDTFGSVWLFIPWSAFVIVAASNAVNLTDGLDGLAAGCTVITALAMILILPLVVPADSRILLAPSQIVLSALVGACLGFLWFNRFPAKVFMGDAGSLPIGALLAIPSLATRTEFVFAAASLVFVLETASVILQVASFRLTGRRVLRCSPLHHHFVFQGIAETRIVRSFWLLALAAGILTGLFAVLR